MTSKLLTIKELEKRATMRRSNVYRLMRAGKFPLPIIMGDKSVRWIESEIEEYIANRPRATGTGPGTFPGAKEQATA